MTQASSVNQVFARLVYSNQLASREQIYEYWGEITEGYTILDVLLKNNILNSSQVQQIKEHYKTYFEKKIETFPQINLNEINKKIPANPQIVSHRHGTNNTTPIPLANGFESTSLKASPQKKTPHT